MSFDVTSLFTNVPLEKTINILLDCIYNQHVVTTNLSKRSLHKLIKETCTKTAFLSNNKVYEQLDGVSMGSSLGPVTANIIMTELENTTIKPLINDNTIKFYSRFVDDTLLVVKAEHIPRIHNLLNQFDHNLQFTVDMFKDEIQHFLDLEISNSGLTIYRKDAHTGQYVNFSSYTPWKYKVSWIKSLVSRAKQICSPNLLSKEIRRIKRYIFWNGFPKQVGNRLINNILKKKQHGMLDTKYKDDDIKIWFRLPYTGVKGESIVKNCISKLKRCLKKDAMVKFIITYDTKRISYYTNNKDKIPLLNHSFVVYEFKCPGCNHNYIGKTERTLFERSCEHGFKDKNSVVLNHIVNCEQVNFIKSIFSLTTNATHPIIDTKQFNINLVQENLRILDRSRFWNDLLIKEALKIKEKKPTLNNGLKASKELKLF